MSLRRKKKERGALAVKKEKGKRRNSFRKIAGVTAASTPAGSPNLSRRMSSASDSGTSKFVPIVATKTVAKSSPLVHFAAADAEKHFHVILRFNLSKRTMEYLVPDKQLGYRANFNDMSASEVDVRDREIQLNVVDDPDGKKYRRIHCYNEFDLHGIDSLIKKVMSKANDLEEFAESLKPQLCFLRTAVKLNSKRSKEKVDAVLVERQLILLPPESGAHGIPKMIIPLYKRPCFTISKTCIRFDMTGESVDIFFTGTEERDQWYEAISIASSKTPADILPLRKKLQSLDDLHQVTFTLGDPLHAKFLKRLWVATVGVIKEGEPYPEHGLSARWKDIGFSDVDPTRDFAVCGMLGLENAVYFAENYPRALKQILEAQLDGGDKTFPVMKVLNKISFMIMHMIKLKVASPTWYPVFTSFPLFTFDANAFETTVCIALQLFARMWESDSMSRSDTSRCMSNLLLQLTEQVERPASEGVPYIYEMFAVLLGDKKNTSECNYSLLNAADAAVLIQMQQKGNQAEDQAHREIFPWAFCQEDFFDFYKKSDPGAKEMMLAPLETDGKILSRDEERKLKEDTRKVDQKWARLMENQNAYLDKLRCLLCQRRKANVICVPCRHMSVCTRCFSEGMKCPQEGCSYTKGYVGVQLALTKTMQTLR